MRSLIPFAVIAVLAFPQRVSADDAVSALEQDLLKVTVMVTVDHGRTQNVGSGVAIHLPGYSDTQYHVLTCAHVFNGKDTPSTAKIKVRSRIKAKGFSHLSYDATLVKFNPDPDLGLVAITTERRIPVAVLAYGEKTLQKGHWMLSAGYDLGSPDPTVNSCRVIDINRYIGAGNILCSGDPAQGRSGGGLFSVATGELFGTCSAADRKSKEGLYVSATEIRKFLEEFRPTPE